MSISGHLPLFEALIILRWKNTRGKQGKQLAFVTIIRVQQLHCKKFDVLENMNYQLVWFEATLGAKKARYIVAGKQDKNSFALFLFGVEFWNYSALVVYFYSCCFDGGSCSTRRECICPLFLLLLLRTDVCYCLTVRGLKENLMLNIKPCLGWMITHTSKKKK